jgi:hypothetical protein
MDVTDLQERCLSAAIAICDDFTALSEALACTGIETSRAEAIVVRNGGPPGEAELAQFAAALVAGAREAQRSATAVWRTG